MEQLELPNTINRMLSIGAFRKTRFRFGGSRKAGGGRTFSNVFF